MCLYHGGPASNLANGLGQSIFDVNRYSDILLGSTRDPTGVATYWRPATLPTLARARQAHSTDLFALSAFNAHPSQPQHRPKQRRAADQAARRLPGRWPQQGLKDPDGRPLLCTEACSTA